VISFTAILWNAVGDLDIFGYTFPRAMFWTVLIYVLIATVVAVWLGRPLIWLSFDNEKLNAAFRYALVACETRRAVGFYVVSEWSGTAVGGASRRSSRTTAGSFDETIIFNG